MLKQLLSLYQKIDENKQKFELHGLNGNFFIDVYRTQPFQPELYEYFSLPAIFVDYQMAGHTPNLKSYPINNRSNRLFIAFLGMVYPIIYQSFTNAEKCNSLTFKAVEKCIYCFAPQSFRQNVDVYSIKNERKINITATASGTVKLSVPRVEINSVAVAVKAIINDNAIIGLSYTELKNNTQIRIAENKNVNEPAIVFPP